MIATPSLFTISLLLAQVILSGASFLDVMMKCMDKLGAPNDDLLKYLDGEKATQNLKCAMKCVSDDYDAFDSNGKYDVPRMLHVFPTYAHDVVEKCGNAANDAPESSDPCEIAYRFEKCFLDADKQMYVTVEEV